MNWQRIECAISTLKIYYIHEYLNKTRQIRKPTYLYARSELLVLRSFVFRRRDQ